ncbi:MFS transporter [Exophiala viscosa]|uniref:MFS transporter n=1 Tax=Exophiala viscosa TaxID=2486360 RepID=UPI00219EC04B|nr:MFS transporter [Exophiala viscosa]
MGKLGEKDIGASVVPEYAQPWDKETERRVVCKIDFMIIPLMWIGYGLVYYDKAILGGATVFGMSTDLKLKVVTDPTSTPVKVSTTRLSRATSLFYFGMLAGVGPLTYLFQRFHLGRTVGVAVVAWGIIAMSTAGVTTYKGLWAQRFCLGVAESIIPTAFLVIISGYYTQAEQTWRQCLWYSATGGWTVLGAIINYGFAHITGGALKKWQYLYLLAGGVTVLYGVVFFFFPNSPAQAWWFTDEEKRVAIERLRMSQLGVRCQKIKWSQFKEALIDVKVYIIAFMMGAAYTVNGAISGFGPLIVSTFGWSAYDSLLWQMPLGGVCFLGILLVGYLSLKVPNIRLIMLIACCLPVIAGCAMIWKSSWYEHAATPIAGYTIIGFFAPVTSLIVSMGMANVAGNTKRSFQAAAIFVFYTVGNIASPFFIVSETVGQHYPRLWEGIIGCYALVIVLAIVLYFMLRSENQRRNRLEFEEKEAERVAFDDLTDKENKYFRYVY